MLSKAPKNALPADQLNAVKDGQPLTGVQGDSALDVATAGMVVGQECLPDTPAKACYPVLPAKDAPEIKDAAGKLLGSANSHAYLAFYGGRPRRLRCVAIRELMATAVATAATAAAANMETHLSDGNGGSGGNEAEDGGSSSAKGLSPLTVPAEQDGSQSSTAS